MSLMVMFSFIGGAAVYRANVHVAVEALLNAVSPDIRRAMLWGVDACMGPIALFMLGYGVHLCRHHPVPDDGRVPLAFGGIRLPADPHRRVADAAVPDRARLGR